LTDLLVAGRVGRPHGLDGSFYVAAAAPALLPVGAEVLVGEQRTEVVARKGTDARPIVRLALAADRDGAEALRGRELRVSRAGAPPLGEDEYWADDLVGCAVLAGGRELGRVEEMLAYPSCDLLRLGDGTLVPLVRDAIVMIDLEARRIEVDAAFLGLDAEAG
jgi:16S rRNA processing protein RimM